MPLPPEAPLDMPEQRLDGNPPAMREVETQPPGLLVKRLLVISATAVLGLAASTDLRFQLSLDGLDTFDVLLLALFVPLVSWIAFGFVTSLTGFIKLMSGSHPGFVAVPRPREFRRHRTAVLMPVYNESVEAIFARVDAMTRSIAAEGGAADFDFFVLSDSNELHGRREEEAWGRLARTAPMRIYYRRRAENIGRKPGNIEEWVRRFGGAYEHMIVLDADSMMSGSAMVGLASVMESKPTVGLLQTVPMIINARTLFQRWMQFASHAYGHIASAGLLWWSGSEANFWGHNAIVRTRAFAESCGLPKLPGRPPFGGYIQSHDMVEAALLRRRGWAVHMVMIDGSYEEFPPTILDNAVRDRRWAQGNLQHLRLLASSGLHWTSRLHLLIGASAYLTSTAWLLLVLIQCKLGLSGHESLVSGGSSYRSLALTALYLFGPKLMALAWILASPDRRDGFGGVLAVLRSAAIEIVLSILSAPVAMVNQTKALAGLLLGIPSHWTSQNREVDHIPLGTALSKTREHLVLGMLFVVVGVLNPVLGFWLSPMIVGLLGAPWLIAGTSSRSWGDRVMASGTFVVPEPVLGSTPPHRSSRPVHDHEEAAQGA
ncbi:glucans biosynthesis glucosyltransferase MdoH [Novosphingobium mangrovi (ex Huang et al. 2023)]|uniref:glucans biosynthesis glucosyltransferase MdoH n=1 Tax=Novosphingobium mangrovi (ex Huang et al. 2023) TaxID=2976432 RepID=UPI003AF31D5F